MISLVVKGLPNGRPWLAKGVISAFRIESYSAVLLNFSNPDRNGQAFKNMSTVRANSITEDHRNASGEWAKG